MAKRLWRNLALSLALLTLLGGVASAAPAPRVDAVDSPTVTIHFLDIGQGDAILIRTADDKTVLLDAGPPEARSSLLDRLRALGISALDAMIITHAHADHVGGTKAVLEGFPVKLFLDPGYAHTSSMYAGILETIEAKGIRYRQPRRGFKVKLGQYATMAFLAPEEPLLAGTRSDVNANSFVIKLSIGDVDVMLTGDAEAETEARVLAGAEAPLECEVLKVAHHGSEYSSTVAFLDAVHPVAGVISVGVGNRYGHPAPPTLRKLEKAGIQVFRTDTDGEVVLQSDGKTWSLHANRPVARPASGAGTPEPPTGEAEGGLIDINSASAAELTRLPGIGKRKAEGIVAWRQANGPFASVDELSRVKGIGARIVERLAPMATAGTGRVAAPHAQAADGSSAAPPTAPVGGGEVAPPATAGGGIDLNRATESDLVSLPGIGHSKARAILAYRDQRGGFTAVEQLGEVKGIGAKTLGRLRPLVRVGGGSTPSPVPPMTDEPEPDRAPAPRAPGPTASGLVDLNVATEADLVRLPGIGPAKARAILELRGRIGAFGSVDQLGDVKGIGAKTLDRLRPLVTVAAPP